MSLLGFIANFTKSLQPTYQSGSSFLWRMASIAGLLILLAGYSFPQDTKLPQEVTAILNAPEVPNVTLSPTRDYLILAERDRYQSLAELARPKLEVADLRIDEPTYSLYGESYWSSLKIKKINLADCCQNEATPVLLPAKAKITLPVISFDGEFFAFTMKKDDRLELWVGSMATAKARPVLNLKVSSLFETAVQWMPDQKTLLVRAVPEQTGGTLIAGEENPAAKPPIGSDAATLFKYYATSQLTLVNVVTGQTQKIGEPACWESVEPSPDGLYLYTRRILTPKQYEKNYEKFPVTMDIFDRAGNLIRGLYQRGTLAKMPAEDVRTGPRGFSWRATAPSTLVWAEALDGGNSDKKAVYRDRIMMQEVPFTKPEQEIARIKNRFVDIQWSKEDGLAFVNGRDNATETSEVAGFDADKPGQSPLVLWQQPCGNERELVMRQLTNGAMVVMREGNSVYLSGTDLAAKKRRSYLERFDLKTHKTEKLFYSDADIYEDFRAFLANDAQYIVTYREAPQEPPNFYVRSLNQSAHAGIFLRPLTQFPDYAPELSKIQRQFVTYTRADGIALSCVLYLPPGYRIGTTRLPTVISVYPEGYEAGAMPERDSSPVRRYLDLESVNPIFFALHGYAVLEEVTMPVIGPKKTRNDSFIEQLTMDAKAAIKQVVDMKVADPERIGVWGHSYGAFAVGNLLAHTDLFRAGIASSGAYNRTLTPDGFQDETRTLWQARSFYQQISPYNYADLIKEPLLLLHGADDQNEGTIPAQSEKMDEAIRLNGGTSKLVLLPHEGHEYQARESVTRSLTEMFDWFDKYLKGAKTRRQMPINSKK